MFDADCRLAAALSNPADLSEAGVIQSRQEAEVQQTWGKWQLQKCKGRQVNMKYTYFKALAGIGTQHHDQTTLLKHIHKLSLYQTVLDKRVTLLLVNLLLTGLLRMLDSCDIPLACVVKQ